MEIVIFSVFQGLLVALQNATPRSLIVVFTDNGSKDLDLEKEIIRPVTNYKIKCLVCSRKSLKFM